MRIFLLLIAFSGVFTAQVLADSGVLEVNWDEFNSTRGPLSAARKAPYPDVLSQGVEEVKLPVYLPRSQFYNPSMTVVADSYFYSITLPLNTATLVVTGDRTFQQSLKGSAHEWVGFSMVGVPATFTHAEGIMTVDFNRFGVNYSLSLECEQPKTDSRCLKQGFLKGLFQELSVVRGGR